MRTHLKRFDEEMLNKVKVFLEPVATKSLINRVHGLILWRKLCFLLENYFYKIITICYSLRNCLRMIISMNFFFFYVLHKIFFMKYCLYIVLHVLFSMSYSLLHYFSFVIIYMCFLWDFLYITLHLKWENISSRV